MDLRSIKTGIERMYLVPQRGRYDCGIACVAMATSRSYETVLQTLSDERRELLGSQGLTHYDVFELLFVFRCSYQYVSRWDRLRVERDGTGRFLPRCAWPPKPWAPAHIIQLPGHWMAMDATGQVFDPARWYTALPSTVISAIAVFSAVE